MKLIHNRLLYPIIAGALSLSLSTQVTAQTAVFDPVQKLIASKQYDQAIETLNKLTVSSSEEAEKYRLLAQVYLLTGAGIAAEAAVDRARRLGADYAITAVPYAKALLIQGKYGAAKAALRGVSIPDEYLRDSYIISGDANFAENKFAEAQRDYELAKAKDDTDFQAFLGLARLELRRGNLAKAQEFGVEAESRAADNTMVQYTLGLIARYTGAPAEAEKYFLEAVRLYPDNIMANIEIASSKVNDGKIAEAEALLDKVYAVSPHQPLALYLSAVINASKGNYQEAATLLSRAKGLADVYLPAVYVKGMVAFQLEKYDVAIESLTKVIGARPDNKPARLALATSYSKSERPATALKILAPLLEAEQVDLNVLTVAASAAVASGDAAKGEEYYKRASALKASGASGGVGGLSTKLALAQYAVGDSEKALATLSSVIAGSEVDLRELGLMGSMQIRAQDYEGAEDTINRVLKLAPDRALGYNMRGTLEFKRREYAKSIVSYSKALDISGNYHTARRNRGLSYMQLGDYKNAKKDLKQVLSDEPNDVLTKAVLAKTLLLMGEAAESTDYFREAIRVMPRSVKLATDYAQALTDAGITTQAIEQARKAAVMGQDDPAVLKRMGLLLLRLQQPAAAERPLSRYAAFNPNSGEAHVMHGRAMLQMGLYTGSAMSFSRAETATNDLADKAELEWYFFTAEALGNKYDRAAARLSSLNLSKRPADIKASIVGDFLLATGEPVKAEESYRSIMQNEPTSDVVIGLANALSSQEKAAEAIKELEKYLTKKPEDRIVLASLGKRYEAVQKYDDASRQYEKILRSGVADAQIAARLAYVYLMLGNNKSIKLASSAHLMMPDDPFIQDVYGWVILQAGRNTEESIEALEKAVRRDPAKAIYKYHLGMAYVARGNRVDARKFLEQALSLDPTFEGASEARRQLSLLDY
ncbi:XrtA/PEP-CTERM system TPR-repeat protein PrsT [Kordiimonas pumila]|uniref:XrtA/PEP-CTERM system TPR-repeat protein PrsT n=1 Tax=Kordiimonas pumila TaxID=2161677 RepID=A0ABV7D3L6_9PROT|nr:XrtA/PEP-CTERM system TPR-repeat protein PrsT [Kordiimonas pumila]